MVVVRGEDKEYLPENRYVVMEICTFQTKNTVFVVGLNSYRQI